METESAFRTKIQMLIISWSRSDKPVFTIYIQTCVTTQMVYIFIHSLSLSPTLFLLFSLCIYLLKPLVEFPCILNNQSLFFSLIRHEIRNEMLSVRCMTTTHAKSTNSYHIIHKQYVRIEIDTIKPEHNTTFCWGFLETLCRVHWFARGNQPIFFSSFCPAALFLDITQINNCQMSRFICYAIDIHKQLWSYFIKKTALCVSTRLCFESEEIEFSFKHTKNRFFQHKVKFKLL